MALLEIENLHATVGDTDGYGLASSTTTACAQPFGYAAVSGDCSGCARIRPDALGTGAGSGP